MAAQGGKGGRRPGTPGKKSGQQKNTGAKGGPQKGRSARPATKRPVIRFDEPAAATALPDGPFRLGVIPGATPGRWIDTWQTRMPGVRLDLVPLDVAAQERALRDGQVDAALVRPPVDTDAWHLIRLYDELPVVVFGVDSALGTADELTASDLQGEVLIVPRDDVLDARLEGTAAPGFAAPATTGDAIEIVATGVGITVVPMSLARLHHRKDIEYRPLVDGPVSPVGLAWPREDASPLVDTFIGIVRGRTAQSSRD